MRKIEIWDIIFWTAMIILILFIVAKLAGIINTPDWINLIPLITVVFLVGAFYQKVVGFMERMYSKTDYIKNKIDNHEKRILYLEKEK